MKNLKEFEMRTSEILAYQLNSESDPLEFAKKAQRTGLIAKRVLDHLTSLYPEVPSKLEPLNYRVLQKLHKALQKKENEPFNETSRQTLTTLRPY